MLDDQKHADDICLNQIESLSKQISDLINCGNYDQVKDLDNTRLDLIKNFKDKNNKNFHEPNKSGSVLLIFFLNVFFLNLFCFI